MSDQESHNPAEGESPTEDTMRLFGSEEEMRAYFEALFAPLPEAMREVAIQTAMQTPHRYNVGLMPEAESQDLDLWEEQA